MFCGFIAIVDGGFGGECIPSGWSEEAGAARHTYTALSMAAASASASSTSQMGEGRGLTPQALRSLLPVQGNYRIYTLSDKL